MREAPAANDSDPDVPVGVDSQVTADDATASFVCSIGRKRLAYNGVSFV